MDTSSLNIEFIANQTDKQLDMKPRNLVDFVGALRDTPVK